MAQVALPLLATTLVALLMANLVGTLRWHLILSAEAPSPGPAVLLKIVLVGLFFKSRIPAALAERLHAEPYIRLRYFCSPYHQDSALYPFIDQLGRASGRRSRRPAPFTPFHR